MTGLKENPYIKLAIALAQKHYEGDDEAFRATAQELAQQLFADGKDECGSYIDALLYPELAFVPMGDQPKRPQSKLEHDLQQIEKGVLPPLGDMECIGTTKHGWGV